MKFEPFTRAAIAQNLPAHGLLRGDLVTVVEYLPANEAHPEGYIVEVFSVKGESLGVIGVIEHQLMPLWADAVPSMRALAEAA